MAVNITVDFKISKKLEKALKDMKKPIDKETARAVGEAVVEGMKALIAKGQSPIAGNGRFPAYKDPKKYPGTRKPKSPVNLKLTGDFLDDLIYRLVTHPSGYAASIRYATSESRDKELGHREGANGQPKRPTLPTGSGEDLSKSIKSEVTKILTDRILEVLKGKG